MVTRRPSAASANSPNGGRRVSARTPRGTHSRSSIPPGKAGSHRTSMVRRSGSIPPHVSLTSQADVSAKALDPCCDPGFSAAARRADPADGARSTRSSKARVTTRRGDERAYRCPRCAPRRRSPGRTPWLLPAEARRAIPSRGPSTDIDDPSALRRTRVPARPARGRGARADGAAAGRRPRGDLCPAGPPTRSAGS